VTLWAIVPVKPLRRGKSRLAGTLSDDERTELNRMLLERTLTMLSDLEEVQRILVVSRDPHALAIARSQGARTMREDGQPQLNRALQCATTVAQAHSARSVLVLPADLPLVTREDLRTLIGRATEPPVVVIAPDRRERGTNALLMSPAGLIDYDFGENSFGRHCARAREIGARLEIVNLPTLGLDLDLPEDLDLIKNLVTQE